MDAPGGRLIHLDSGGQERLPANARLTTLFPWPKLTVFYTLPVQMDPLK